MFEQQPSNDYLRKLETGLTSFSNYLYNLTDGYSSIRDVVLVKGRCLQSVHVTILHKLVQTFPCGLPSSAAMAVHVLPCGRQPSDLSDDVSRQAGRVAISLTGEYQMKKFLAILLATGFASTAALAADFTAADADQNGSVSMEEAKAAMPDLADDAFKAADGDQNGELSADEWDAIQG